ncbi:MAG TPA: DUF523 domain-containing protein [Paenibacillaceae bacterium]|nr:DUF523 domain-containing protein [Paenibacillaceae bacterium]
MIIVSACLMGCCCRYDEKNNLTYEIAKLVQEGKAIPICPEQVGGLSTPRPPAEIIGGNGFDVLEGKARVVDVNGKDVTPQFLKGAQETLKMAQLVGATSAILKQRSPSCGSKEIYDGSFSHKRIEGMGVTAALLTKNGIKVTDEDSSK